MSPAIQRDIATATRNEVRPETVARVIVSNLKMNPKLQECNLASLLNAVVTSLSLGLEPDNVRGLAYLVPFKNNKARTTDCVLIPGYMGYIQLGYRSGQVAAWNVPQIVYENEEHSYKPSILHPVRHHALPPDKRGKERIAVYCRVDLKTGGSVWAWLWASEVAEHRERSRAKDSGPWVTDEDAMWKKTACLVVRKFIPSSPTLQLAGALDEQAESGRDQSLYQVTTDVVESNGQSTEEMLEAQMRKVQAADAEQGNATEPGPETAPEPADVTAARELDTLRRKALGMWTNLPASKRANVVKNVASLDALTVDKTLKETTDTVLLQAVLDTIPGA
jgi:recombination protein RecT